MNLRRAPTHGVTVPWNNPLDPARVTGLLEAAALPPSTRVLDVGCGTGELLAGSHFVDATGVDTDEAAIESARRAAPRHSWIHGDARAASPAGPFGLILCLGATHAFGAGADALTSACAWFRSRLEPGGWLLIGEGYQRQPLPPAYAAFLGSPSGIERTHLENVRAIEAAGFVCQGAITAGEAEWDAFEWAFFRRRGHVAWRDMWLEHGRATMGFGAYLARCAMTAETD